MDRPNLRTNWGVPDWRNKDTYPRADDLTLTQWRWEFLRRRNDYRADFLNHIDHELDRRRAISGEEFRLTVEDPNFCVYMPGSMEKYGVDYLRNPIAPEPGLGMFVQTYGSVVGGASRGDLENLLEKEKQIVICFDLTKPVEPQLAKARQMFEIYQNEEVGVVGRRRRHKDKWPLYLRVIDARDAGATWEQIGEIILLPDPDEVSEAEYDSHNSENLPQLARGVWERAQELMNNFPS